ncbi:hypothetical protein M0R45_019527 [Rubus argutus]|uniref:Aminotransferase-like plant mobile domain-containing protein n=1 Tax=Rubus argutus TaxID=59490 RepID=A0AAW1X6Z4_RUBAR
MAQASEFSQLETLCDTHFSLKDGLSITHITTDQRSDSEETPEYFISPESISRLLIERGESRKTIAEAGLTIPLILSSFCDIFKDDICLRHVVRRWSPQTHTFVCLWGEFTPTLEDVYNIMGLPITGNTDPFDITLDEDSEKKLKILQEGAGIARGKFQFHNWVKYFWGSTEDGVFKNGKGFRLGCHLEAMLAYWLSRYIFTDFPCRTVQQRVLPLAVVLATGARLPLAPLFLGHFYKRLDLISSDEKDGAGHYGVASSACSAFLQVFLWERFKGLAAEPTTPKSLNKLKGEDQSWACPGRKSMFLTTTLHHMPTYGDRFEPIVVKYSPQRVRRQFGVNQDVPIGGFASRTTKSIIVSFIKHDENSRKSMFSNCLGTQDGMGAPTPAYKKFWELELCEFGKFIRLSGSVSRCHEPPSKNRRLVSSKTVMGITSKHNLTYVETYSNGVKHLVGNSKNIGENDSRIKSGGSSGSRKPCLTSKGGKKKDNRKVPYFKSKLSKDYVSFTSDSGVRMMLSPDALPSKKGKKRKVISGSKASYTPTKQKAKLSDRKVGCENSSSGDSYNEGERANSTEIDNSCNESGRDDTNASEENSYYESEGSDLGASEEEVSKESHEDTQDTSTQELVNQCGEVRSSDVEAGMKVASSDEDVILDDVLVEPIVMLDSSDGNYNEQDGPTSSTIREASKEASGSDITGIVTSVGGGGSVDHWATRIDNFMTNFESRDRSNITLDDITPPLGGSQSVFEGRKIPSEFVIPLTNFAAKYGGGSLSNLFEEDKSFHQRHILTKELGYVLFSMEYGEVKTEESFLVWRDMCRDMVNWGFKVEFMLDHLKQAARNFFGYKLKPVGSEDCCKEVCRLERAVLELKSQLSNLECQLEQAQEELHSKLGGVISSDNLVCILRSSWTPQSRAIHGLY